jgi:type I restriction enzyme, R subunit
MSPDVGDPERKAQNRLIKLYQEQLGYDYLGNWQYDRENSNIEVEYLEQNLEARGYGDDVITRAIYQLQRAAALGGGRDLYEANKEVYELLRYGIKVKPDDGDQYVTVWPIDWQNLEANHFAIAEEVTVKGTNNKRPDIVLYVNGIAVGIIELKRSWVSVGEGIRQTIGNQRPEFIRQFFTTNQLVFAGNDVEGLRYGVIGTPEKYWLQWREPSNIEEPLDRAITQLTSKERLLEIIHDFIIFDGGVKKICRHNQYFGVKASQARVEEREGGIIWHTQGSGKSLTMVWLAKWIREHQQDARVVLITDRTELDDQIQRVFLGVSEQIYRTSSGSDLLSTLNQSQEWLICSLIHKFRGSDSDADRAEAQADFLKQIASAGPEDFSAKGNIFVFVDEAHRTQSGKLHDAMAEILPDAMFVGFTGTPLLKTDKATSIEKFGSFIHTYKFDEAVRDGVVLDLRYEARNIEQDLTSPEKVDKWFEIRTAGLTNLAKAQLKQRWGTVQKVTSAEPRSRQIVDDILMDTATKPRLMDGRGNAMLVCASIYQACKIYDLFCNAGFKGKCAIVTSYEPNPSDISREDSGEGATERIRQYEIYRQMLADHFGLSPDEAMHKVEQFEKEVKDKFVSDPASMRLLIVVDKLLTGFDAPPATYLYIDKNMQDHGLFQAICRVNRLDGDDKDYGYIVDYRNLFNSVKGAITDYTSGALDGYEKADIEGLLTDRIEQAREDLDNALEQVKAICEGVAQPKGTLQYQRYFCATEPGDAEQLKANEQRRTELYMTVARLVRAYANLANDMAAAGYSDVQAAEVKTDVAHYVAVRDEVKLGAGENIDLKQFEAGMRQLLDNYIQAKPSELIADFGGAEAPGLVDLIVEKGEAAIDELPEGIKNDSEAVAETIANNTRKVIIDERATNPKYYDRMSELLDSIIEQQKQGAIDYKQYLKEILDLATQVGTQEADVTYPDWADNGAKKALFDFGFPSDDIGLVVDAAVGNHKPDSWVGNRVKERRVRLAVQHVLPPDFDRIDELMALLKARDEYR